MSHHRDMWAIWKRKEDFSPFEQFIFKSSFEPHLVHKINPPFINANKKQIKKTHTYNLGTMGNHESFHILLGLLSLLLY
jgi:hypothetical protein